MAWTTDKKRGKYDDQLAAALKSASGRQGILLVLDGSEGPGFSVSIRSDEVHKIPDMLRIIAESVEKTISEPPPPGALEENL